MFLSYLIEISRLIGGDNARISKMHLKRLLYRVTL